MAVMLVATGCAPKIVKPMAPPGSGVNMPYQGGPVAEQDVHMVQATLKPVYFAYDQYTLAPEAQAALQFNADVLRKAPNVRIVVEGHCDERGTDEYNLALGERRARAAVDYLVSLGVPPGGLTTVSYGSELPVDPGHNEAAWSQNRRAFLRASR